MTDSVCNTILTHRHVCVRPTRQHQRGTGAVECDTYYRFLSATQADDTFAYMMPDSAETTHYPARAVSV